MTLAEFNDLNEKDQLEVTWVKGILDDNITFGNHQYILYKLYDFFVEIAFRSDNHEIIQIKSFA